MYTPFSVPQPTHNKVNFNRGPTKLFLLLVMADCGAPFADVDQSLRYPNGGSEGMAQEKRPPDKAASADRKPSTARKQSRIEEILRVIEKYAHVQREEGVAQETLH